MDDYYVDQRGPGGKRIATQVAKQLSEPVPYDLSEVDLRHYRGLLPRWQEWAEVLTVCRQVADMRLSTLRSYIEAVGGRLRMVVTWPASGRQADLATGDQARTSQGP